MPHSLKYCSLFILITLLVSVGCVHKTDRQRIVTVTIEPQRYFAERIAGDLFEINTIVPAGSSPESYDPSPSLLVLLSKSSAYFKIGHIGFELAWMDKIAENNAEMRIFDNSVGIQLIQEGHICSDEVHLHQNSVDPHIWSSPKAAKVIVQNMCDAFIELDPKNKKTYERNTALLQSEIAQLDSLFIKQFSTLKTRSFVVYHPSLGYLARDYGLQQLCIETNGKEPSPRQLKEMLQIAQVENVQAVLIQNEFNVKNAQLAAETIGCKAYGINPLGYDWPTEMRHIANILQGE